MFQEKYLKYKVKYLKLKKELKISEGQKGGNKKNISTWGGQTPSQDNNNEKTKKQNPISKWD